MLSFSQPTYAYKIYRNLLHHFQLTNPHNLHMHTRYIRAFWDMFGDYENSQPTYAYKIYQYRYSCWMRNQDSQPTYAYKIYRGKWSKKMMQSCLTTYICIQDISSGRRTKARRFPHNLHMHTRYIGDISNMAAGERAHNLHMHTRYICLRKNMLRGQSRSQPTYAYKIYRC